MGATSTDKKGPIIIHALIMCTATNIAAQMCINWYQWSMPDLHRSGSAEDLQDCSNHVHGSFGGRPRIMRSLRACQIPAAITTTSVLSWHLGNMLAFQPLASVGATRIHVSFMNDIKYESILCMTRLPYKDSMAIHCITTFSCKSCSEGNRYFGPSQFKKYLESVCV